MIVPFVCNPLLSRLVTFERVRGDGVVVGTKKIPLGGGKTVFLLIIMHYTGYRTARTE